MSPGRVVAVELYRLRLPLRAPYRLSFGTVEEFELFLVTAWLDDERFGAGECVPLPVYSAETPDSVWEGLQRSAQELLGVPAGRALELLERGRERRPFATAPLLTALETALEPPVPAEELAVALLGTVLSHHDERSADEIERLLAEGYTTLKVKVGFEPGADARWVARVQELVAGRAQLRVDANQGYALEDAVAFARQVDPLGIEVFEQPFEPSQWEAMARLAERSPLPLMLDESIATGEDLERLIDSGCASAVKFKLAKAGGIAALVGLIERARTAGLKVVLGNGVAGDVGNLHELFVAAHAVDTAGEMNGFLKPRTRLLANPYEVAGGRAHLPRGYEPALDWERIDAHAVASATVAPTAPAAA